MATARIGTVDIPVQVDRARYFRELPFLELSALFAGPLKPAATAKWAASAPAGALGLVAPWVLTHRRPPPGSRLWRHDGSQGDFRDSEPGRQALLALHSACRDLGASHVIFRSPPLFAPSAAHRDQLRRFFGELATAEAVGAHRVWIPDGLWEPRAAIAFASELSVACAFDPLVRAPGQPPEIYYDLELPALYLRISGLGRMARLSDDKLEDVAALVDHYAGIPATIVFESPARWHDARNLQRLLREGPDADLGPSADLDAVRVGAVADPATTHLDPGADLEADDDAIDLDAPVDDADADAIDLGADGGGTGGGGTGYPHPGDAPSSRRR